jgi:hypothetical protein
MALAVGEDLATAETQELQRHLQDCSTCQQTWEQHQLGFAALQQSRTLDTRLKSDSVWPTVANRLREREAAPQRAEFNGWIAALAVTAACVVLFVFSIEDPPSMAAQQQQGGSRGNVLVKSPNHSGADSTPLRRRDELRRTRPYDPVGGSLFDSNVRVAE